MKRYPFLLSLVLVSQMAFSQIIKPVVLPQKMAQENPEITKFKRLEPKTEVWFYEHVNYTGKKYILTTGMYNLKTLGMSANDFFSSALITRGLKVIVFEDDNLKGDCYQLWPDYKPGYNIFQPFNANFEKVEIWDGKNTLNQNLKGFKDINDKISSILIYDESKDFVTIYEGRFFEGKARNLYPFDLDGDGLKNVNGTWGYANLESYKFNDIVSSLKMNGIVSSCKIFEKFNFLGDNINLFTNANLKDVGYSTGLFPGINNSDWNDRTSSLILNFNTGKITVEN